MCAIDCVLLRLDWTEPMMQFLLYVTCSCISHAHVLYFSIYLLYLNYFGAFLIVSFFPLWPRTLFILVPFHLLISLLSLFGSVMMMPTRHSRRTFLDAAFILNAKSFWRTLPTPTFPLSFIVENGSHYVTFLSLVLSCLSKSFTPTCTGLII